MKMLIAVATLPLAALGGCVATANSERLAAETASCKQMEARMGVETSHDHAEMKGMGMNPMNLSHQRCQKLLAGAK